MVENVLKLDDINDNLPSEKSIQEINPRLDNTDKLVERAFNELRDNDIIEGSPTERTLTYESQDGLRIVESTYAIFGNISYLSWISVSKPLRNNGIGTKVVNQIIKLNRKRGVDRIYTLPKSSEARTVFKNLGFEPTEDIPGGWYVNYL